MDSENYGSDDGQPGKRTSGMGTALSMMVIGSLFAVGFAYFYKRQQEARMQADEDTKRFRYTHLPLMLIGTLLLWVLLFRNPLGLKMLGKHKQKGFFHAITKRFRSKDKVEASSASLLGADGGDVTSTIEEAGKVNKSVPQFSFGFVVGSAAVLLVRMVLLNL